jgi:hypothetical protein
MSRALKIGLGVVAAIAIPFAAPAIAAKLGAATLLTKVGLGATAAGIGGAALVGAGLGAGVAALTGQNIGRGALMGGLTSGAGALLRGPSAVAGAKGGSAAGAAGTAGTAAPMSAIPASSLSAAPMTPIPAGALTGGASAGGSAGGIAGAVGGAAAGVKTGIAGALSKPGVGLAAGALAGAALSGSGLSAAQRAAMQAGQADLDRLNSQNQMVFDARFRGANELLRMSDYVNPEYEGLQAARRAQLQGAAARSDALRGRTGYRRDAESRRLDLDTARNVGTAFDSGFTGGFNRNVAARTAGLSALPDPPAGLFNERNQLLAIDELRRRRRDTDRENFGALWGHLVNPSVLRGS